MTLDFDHHPPADFRFRPGCPGLPRIDAHAPATSSRPSPICRLTCSTTSASRPTVSIRSGAAAGKGPIQGPLRQDAAPRRQRFNSMYDLISPPLPPGRRTLDVDGDLARRDLHGRSANGDSLHLAFEDGGAAALFADRDFAAGGLGFVLALGVIVADDAPEKLAGQTRTRRI